MSAMLTAATVTLIGTAFLTSDRKKRGQITKERTVIFETAMSDLKDPERLEKLADSFQKEGLKEHADLLRKRANLRRLPDDVKKQRREIFRKAMASRNPDAIELVANAFYKEGCIGASKALREHAEAVREIKASMEREGVPEVVHTPDQHPENDAQPETQPHPEVHPEGQQAESHAAGESDTIPPEGDNAGVTPEDVDGSISEDTQ
jgi:hypothetical protein